MTKTSATLINFCSRCGDEIPADELALLKDTSLCALCWNMRLESLSIRHSVVKKTKPALTLLTFNTTSRSDTTA